ncbi:MAG: CPBP family intramembrane metalloprotease [Tannerellaceae bacterium]|jgi:membrane protease YdiL (CAAX protease family)|nr:CPBP family intramembrane metalloprotease [Tannerellaceae bacterium]
MKFLERSFDPTNRIWKYLLVFICALFLWPLIGFIPLIVVSLIPYLNENGIAKLPLDGAAMISGSHLSNNMWLFFQLLSTAIALFLTVWLVKLLHRRSFAEVVNGTKKIRIKRILTGAGVWFALMTITYAVDFVVCREDYVLQFSLPHFLPLLFISLLLMPFQTTGEEFLFRGYLTQGCAALTRKRWAAALIPALCFGLMHAPNPEVREFGFWIMMPQYIYFGLFFGLVAILDDGIELSMGLHAANNIFLSLFATHRSSALQTDAVLEVTHIYPLKDTLLLVLLSLIAGLYFAWKYKWNLRNVLKEPLRDS